MKSIVPIFCVIAPSLLGTASASTNSTLDALVLASTDNIQAILTERSSWNVSKTCTAENVAVRKEWSTLTSLEKLDYIDAVKCLMNTKPITPPSAAPGVRSRFDDFGALHVNKTSMIHWTSYFFTWHRYYTWLYESALRNECGYNGTQPYWDWSSTDTIAEHPLFDGTATSMSGNGAPAANHTSIIYLPTPDIINSTLPSGSGGGCLTSGPFVNFTVTLGPHGAPLNDGLQLNERCLTRDFRDWYLQEYLSYDNVTTAMVQPDLQSYSNVVGSTYGGLHDGGHQAIGGLQDDLWASSQDPYFFFHHAQIDRIWSLWQGLDQDARTKQVSDTITIRNLPPSANGTLETVVDMGFLAEAKTIGELSSTIDGPFCYVYT